MAKRTGATKNKAAKPAKAVKERAKTRLTAQPLPGLENARIQELETVASDYAEIRDQRIALNVDESKLKDRAMHLMRQHGKTVYKRDGIEIKIVPGEEEIKVKVQRPAEAGV